MSSPDTHSDLTVVPEDIEHGQGETLNMANDGGNALLIQPPHHLSLLI